jgi:hypothetical protein
MGRRDPRAGKVRSPEELRYLNDQALLKRIGAGIERGDFVEAEDEKTGRKVVKLTPQGMRRLSHVDPVKVEQLLKREQREKAGT